MKKKAKKILFATLGALVLVGTAAGIIVAIDVSDGNVSGTVYVTNLKEGTGKEDWVKYSVNIPFHYTDTNKYYTNVDGDYITDINFRYSTDCIKICYYNWFNFFDDFDTLFVLSNMKTGNEEKHFVTGIETSHFAGTDSVDFSYTDLDPDFFTNGRKYDTIESYHIVEMWIRTDD